MFLLDAFKSAFERHHVFVVSPFLDIRVLVVLQQLDVAVDQHKLQMVGVKTLYRLPVIVAANS